MHIQIANGTNALVTAVSVAKGFGDKVKNFSFWYTGVTTFNDESINEDDLTRFCLATEAFFGWNQMQPNTHIYIVTGSEINHAVRAHFGDDTTIPFHGVQLTKKFVMYFEVA